MLCSQTATMKPKDGPAQHELYVGLVLQFHYVGNH